MASRSIYICTNLTSLGAFSMEMIIERTKAHGMQGQVAISHAFCLGMA